MSSPVNSDVVAQQETSATSHRDWLVSPWFDALLLANVGWPLLLLWQMGEGFQGREGLAFWQVYFLTTPHRWITLVLVFCDRKRFSARPILFVALAAFAVLLCLGIRMATGALTCLFAVDYIWNAWHYAAQHHGIYRIYSRVAGAAATCAAVPQQTALALEKWSLRIFLLYVILRVAGVTWPYTTLESSLAVADGLFLAVPVWLLVRDLVQLPRSMGRTLYLLSVSGLYIGLLAAVHFSRPALVLSLTTATAVFHATEYLAIVTWNVHGRSAAVPVRSTRPQELGLMSYFAPRWALVLGMFLLVIGAGNWLVHERMLQTYLTTNVIVAFLHYAYDGLIWRSSSRPSASRPSPMAPG